MSEFGDRLKKNRFDAGFTQRGIAKSLGISERAYQHYEAGTREPNIANLVALADYFGVSIDYLVGRSDDPARR